MTAATRKRPKQPLDHEPEAVAYARKNSGLTQEQVAEACGVTQPHISEIEKGTRNAPPALLNKLARVLNCPRVVLERKREAAPAAEAASGEMRPVRDGERAEPPEVHQSAVPGAAVGSA